MNISRKSLCILLAFIIAVLTVSAQFVSLSPTLDIIQSGMELKKCAVVNCEVQFSAADFDSVLRNKVEYITVTSLPDSRDGTLMLDGVNVMENQTISRSKIDSLSFVPSPDRECCAVFSFADSLDETLYGTCTVNILGELNLSPETGEQTVETQRNIAAFKFLMAADPENDTMTFDVVSYPKNGCISISENGSGFFEYSPSPGYTGKDSFVYTATDVYGNVSKQQKVNINVVRPVSEVYFDDMKEHWAHNSAVKIASTGLMSGTGEDGKLVFLPESGITRGDFLAISLIMSGYEDDIASVDKTVFADDNEIPANIKSYAQYAYDKGIVSGYNRPDGTVEFRSTSTITRAEAAVIVDKLLSLPEPGEECLYNDASSIPDWASSSVASLTACGILNGTGGGDLKPDSCLTRGQAAEMICNVSDYIEDREKELEEKPKKTIFNLFGLLG